MKFTKGNTVASFGKLTYLQKLYAQKYIEEGGPKFENMVTGILSIVGNPLQSGEGYDCPSGIGVPQS